MNPRTLTKLRLALIGAGASVFVLLVSTASGANPGDPFKLGIANTINASTSLSGTTAGPQLKVVNSNTTNHAILAQAGGGGSGIAVFAQHPTTAGNGPALRADSASTATNAFSLYAVLSSTTPGTPSAAIRAESKSTDVQGYGLWASQAGLGYAVYGTSVNGTGVYGKHSGAGGIGAGVVGDSAAPGTGGVVGRNFAGGPGVHALVIDNSTPPLRVNSTGHVDLLNVDLLDGKDSSAFWQLGGNNPGSTGILGTNTNQALELKVNDQRALRIEPNATSPNLIGGFAANTVAPGVIGATIGGGGAVGVENKVTGGLGTVGGGWQNTAGGSATVAGGQLNTASGDYSAAAGGFFNTASGNYSVAAGGDVNTASGRGSAVAGGFANSASGEYSFAGGGSNNTASGNVSFAAGKRAKATQIGSFVWGDSSDADVTSPAADTFTVRARGGIWLGTTSSPSIPANHFLETSTGGYLSSGGIWTSASDRALKHDFRPLTTRSVLERVARMPITSWSYKAESPSVRHIGPVAQDFYQAFGLGLDDKHIGTIDEGGVALAAIQGLYRQNRAQGARLERVERQNRMLRARLAKLERELTTH